MMKKFLTLSAILLAGITSCTARTQAAVIHWNGAASGTWETAASWAGGVIPGPTDAANIGKNAVLTASTDSLTLQSLTVGYSSANYAENAGTGSLTAASSAFTVTGSLNVGYDASGSLTVGTAGTSDTVSIGSGSESHIYVGVCTSNGPEGAKRSASVDFSAVENVTLNAGTISLLEAVSGNVGNYLPNVSMTLGTNNNITANTLKMGETAGPNLSNTSTAITLGSGTNTLKIAEFIVAGQKAQGNGTECASVTAALGAGDAKTAVISLSGKTEGTAANLYIGYNNVASTGNCSNGLMDFTNAASVNMTLNQLIVARNVSCTNAANTTHGTLILGDNADVTAASLQIATQTNSANVGPLAGILTYGGKLAVTGDVTLGNAARSASTFTMNSGTLSVGGSVTGNGTAVMNLSGTATIAGSVNLAPAAASVLNVKSGSTTIAGSLSVQSLNVAGPEQTASLTVGTAAGTADTVTIGNNGTGTFNVAWWTGTEAVNHSGSGTVDFSNVETVKIDVASMNLEMVAASNAVGPSAAVTLGKDNSITANSLKVATSTGGNLSSASGTLTLGRGTNTLKIDTILIGGSKAEGTDGICGTLNTVLGTDSAKTSVITVTGKSTEKASLHIAYNDFSSTANSSQGTVDFSNASRVNMTLSDISIAYNTYVHNAAKKTNGSLILGSNATVTADSITMASMGENNVAQLNASLSFAGSLTVAEDITMGTSSALSTSTLTMNGGTLSVGGSILGTGASTYMQTAGTAVIAENLRVKTFSLGDIGKETTLTVGTADGTADFVSIGDGTTAMKVGEWLAGGGTAKRNITADFSNAETVNINVTALNILTNPMLEGARSASVLLGKSNTITAESIKMGDTGGSNLMNTSASLVLGAENVIKTDRFQVGGAKAEGTGDRCVSVTIQEGGTLTLEGKTDGTLTDLSVGNNTAGATATTSNVSKGLVDFTGAGTVTLKLGDLLLGHNENTGTGASGKNSFGEMILGEKTTLTANTLRLGITDAGTASAKGILTLSGTSSVTADSVQMGNRADSVSVINLAGGSFSANTLTGTGTADFNFTGGSLDVGNFGISLTQNGAATLLTPGGTGHLGTMSIGGGYDFINGRLLIEIGANSCDVLNVVENLEFGENAVLVLDVLEDPTADSYTLLTAGNAEKPEDIIPIWEKVITSGREASFNWTGAAGNWAFVMTMTDPVPVPEPAAWFLMILGVFGLRFVKVRRS